MEDAVCLANQIEAMPGEYEAAFKKYQELRYLRTARVQLMARVFGEIYHASGVNRELRNKLLSEWSEEGSIDMSWLYGHQPELPVSATFRCRRRRGWHLKTTIKSSGRRTAHGEA